MALSLLHGAISFPEKPDLLPSVFFSPACACPPPLGAQPVASLRGHPSGKGRERWVAFLGPGREDSKGANQRERLVG